MGCFLSKSAVKSRYGRFNKKTARVLGNLTNKNDYRHIKIAKCGEKQSEIHKNDCNAKPNTPMKMETEESILKTIFE